MNGKKVLIVEDDFNLGQILSDYLSIKGYQTSLKRDGEEGYNAFMKEEFSICILDVMMPKKDGFTLAKEIREINSEIPIIFLTAKSMKEDAINGLQIGADDYMTKPFSMEELLLRMQAILKRTYKTSKSSGIKPSAIPMGASKLESHLQRLTTPEREIKLTTKESDLLLVLAEHLNETVDRTTALKRIWGDDSYFNARSMDVYIAKLRKYLADDPSIKIQTIHGQGFKLIELDQ